MPLLIERLPGRCANGAERDSGTLWHALQLGSYAALCGAKPGRRSVGWMPGGSLEKAPAVTCPRCRTRLLKLASNPLTPLELQQEAERLNDSANAFANTPRIRKNAWDNWYGYMGNKRVEMFTDGGWRGNQKRMAEEWLAEQLATDYKERP